MVCKIFFLFSHFQTKYEWKPPVKVNVKKEKPVRKVKVAKRKVKPKVTKNGKDVGKENAVQTWKNIFSPKNGTSEENRTSQPKKKVVKKSKRSRGNDDSKTQPMLNFLGGPG